MTIAFQFVESPDGSLEGINDAGIETFAGNRLASLAREQGQNSLDAKRPNVAGPVEVEYSLENFQRTMLPGADELLASVQQAIEYWSEDVRRHKKTIRILQKAKRCLARPTVPMLRISDRNTTGLRGSDAVEQGDWFSLTKASGVSLKGDDAMGSFGIGKNVFWLNSALRTVFFATKDMDGKQAFQGVTKLVSHPLNSGERGGRRLSRSIGFYGQLPGYLPVRDVSKIPDPFRLEEVGTDIVVAGFESDDTWQHSLIAAFAQNFFAAFQQDALRVRIGSHEVSSATIAKIVEALYRTDPEEFTGLRDYFDCLTLPEAREYEAVLPHIGRARLRLLLRDGAKKSIAMFRATGMIIYEQGHFRTPLEFAGVCICDDAEGNRLLRRLEPPSHAAWEPERNEEDPKAAKQAIAELKAWMRRCVQDLYPSIEETTLDVPDLERYLPDDEDEDDPIDSSPKAEAEGDPTPKEEKVLEGKFRMPRQTGGAPAQDLGAGEEPGEVSGSEANDGQGGNRGTTEGKQQTEIETEVFIPIRIFLDPTTNSKYLMRGSMDTAGKFSAYLYAHGDDGRREAIAIHGPGVALQGGPRIGLATKAENGLGPFEIHTPSTFEVDFTAESQVPLALSARITKHGT